MSIAIARYVFGPLAQPIELPAWLSGRVDIGIGVFPAYRVFLIGVGAVLAFAIWVGHRAIALRRVGPRGGRQPADGGVGRHQRQPRLHDLLRARNRRWRRSAEASAPICCRSIPGYPNDYLVYFLIVVAVAGWATSRGAFAVALAFGVVDTVIRYFLPELGRILIFLLVMAVLFRKPHGFAPKIHA